MPPTEPEITHPLPCLLRHVQGKPVIWILGGPGSGKGTQCELLKKKYGFKHLSTGDLLRAEIRRGSERAKCLEDIMIQGDLVPNEIVLNILKEEMKGPQSKATGFLIDGYPREIDQGIAFEKEIAPVSMVIYLEATTDTMMERLRHRSAVATAFRCDDTDKVFQMRIDTFLEHNALILAQYKEKMYMINAELTINEVYAQIERYIDALMETTARFGSD